MKSLRKWGYYLGSIFTLLWGFKNWPWVVKIFLSKDDGKIKTLKLKKQGLTLRVRGKMDVWSVKETLLDRLYTKYGTQIGENWKVMDIGAAIGEFTLLAALSARNGSVVAYEPFPGSFELLQENIVLNGFENVSLYNQAVWGSAGALHLDISSGEPLQMASRDDFVNNIAYSLIEVPAITLQMALEENKVGRLDLLKLDCEGAEFPILLEADAAVWERVERIVMEYHDGFEGHRHEELVKLLERLGYRVRVNKNIVHDDIGYLYAEKTQQSTEGNKN